MANHGRRRPPQHEGTQIIVPHTHTDLDAIGAAVGAQVLYPDARIVLPGALNPLAAEFLSLHRYNLKAYTPRDLDLEQVRRAIVVDTADAARLGPLQEITGRLEIHLYDHHPPEPDDLHGSLEVRDLVGAASTLLAELIEEAGVAITPFQATAMLIGIYADTGSLSLLGTTDRDARAAAFLLSRGASLQAASRFLEISLSPDQQALVQQLQSRSRWLTVGGARICLMLAEAQAHMDGLALVVHRLQELEPGPALFVAVRVNDRIHLVGRSAVPWVDAARALAAFGGGGHPTAAAAVVKGVSLEEAVGRLEAALAASVERPPMARDVMSFPVKTIPAQRPVREAERLMLRHGHTGLPVVNEAGHLEGIISLRDVEKARRHGLEHAPVKGVMKSRVVTVDPDMVLDEVQELMVEKDIGRVPVVSQGNMVGIITRSDLLGLLYGGPPPRWHKKLYAQPEGHHDQGARTAMEAVERAPAAMRALMRTVGQVAERAGIAVYAVGGFVRDLLLGRPNLDFDIVVEGDGIGFAHRLAGALHRRVAEVPRFGTAHLYLDGDDPDLPRRIDVATARREFYEHAAALPVVEHAELREDLYRRDFSINALAIRLGPAGPLGLIDFFGGLADLAEGQIRILHTLSFVEDPTRILRAVRFAHRYGFRMEPDTHRCARSAVLDGFLGRVSRERLRSELVLLLQEQRAGEAIRLLQELDAIRHLLPGAAVDEEQIRLVNGVDALPDREPEMCREAQLWQVRLMALLHALPMPRATDLVIGLRLRREERDGLLHVLAGWQMALPFLITGRATAADIVRLLNGWPVEGLLLLHLLGGHERISQYFHLWRHVRLAITGDEIRQMGVPAGPRVGKILARILTDCLEGRAPDRPSQLELARLYGNEEE